MVLILPRPSTAEPRDPWRPAPSQVACVGFRVGEAPLPAMEHVEHVLFVGTSMPIGIARRIRGEDRELAASSQVSGYMTAVCKAVDFGYPGSNPGPATTSENSLLISPCSGEELVLGCPVASGGNRPATVGPGEYVAKSHTMAVVWPPSPRKAWCIGFRLIGARSGRSSGARPCCAETCPYRLRRGPVDGHAGRRGEPSQPSASGHRGRPSRLQRSGRFARPVSPTDLAAAAQAAAHAAFMAVAMSFAVRAECGRSGRSSQERRCINQPVAQTFDQGSGARRSRATLEQEPQIWGRADPRAVYATG